MFKVAKFYIAQIIELFIAPEKGMGPAIAGQRLMLLKSKLST